MKDRCENYDSCYFLVKKRMKFDLFFPANKLILRPSSNSHRTRKERGDETDGGVEGGGRQVKHEVLFYLTDLCQA